MNPSDISSVTLQPGAIPVSAFAYRNFLIPEPNAGNTGTVYSVPSGASILQTFSGLNGNGNSITIATDLWWRRFLNQRSVPVTVNCVDNSGTGSVTVPANSSIFCVYLLWLSTSVTSPGVVSSLSGTYALLSGQSQSTKSNLLTAHMQEDWISVDVKEPAK